jgi:hypothetical protein
MSLRDLLEASQALSLADRLSPTEEAVWHRYYSKTFSEPLSQVLTMDPLTVLTAVFSDQLDEWDVSERIEDIQDLLGGLLDPSYDINKEKAHREMMKKLIDDDKERLKNNLPIHESLAPKKLAESKTIPTELPKELPKSGGLNMGLIRQLQNEEKETGEF